MSHEIRTPMNGIIGMTDLLLASPLSDPHREQLITVQRSGRALLTILNDILDFSKIEAGRLDVESLRVEVRQTVADVVRLPLPRAQEKGLLLSFGNAVKFTGAGGVRIHVTLETATDQRLRVDAIDSALLPSSRIDLTVAIMDRLQRQLPPRLQSAERRGAEPDRYGRATSAARGPIRTSPGRSMPTANPIYSLGYAEKIVGPATSVSPSECTSSLSSVRCRLAPARRRSDSRQ